jgi:N-acetylglucosamine kinase-like BadF-type ATPase
VILDTDAYVAWAGAFMGKPGIIILAGTVSICLAVDATGRRYRVGGWGPRFGDEGSAYTIAVKGVRQALEALDGRSQDTAFLDALSSFNGLALSSSEDIPTLTSWLYGTAQADATLAQFARCVDQLARQGNKAAEEILRAAGRDLAGLVQVARKRFAEGNPARVALGGSVLQRSTNVRRSLMACLDEAGGFELVKPAASPMIGAVSVALQSGREHMHEGVMERLLSSNSNVSAVEMQ